MHGARSTFRSNYSSTAATNIQQRHALESPESPQLDETERPEILVSGDGRWVARVRYGDELDRTTGTARVMLFGNIRK